MRAHLTWWIRTIALGVSVVRISCSLSDSTCTQLRSSEPSWQSSSPSQTQFKGKQTLPSWQRNIELRHWISCMEHWLIVVNMRIEYDKNLIYDCPKTFVFSYEPNSGYQKWIKNALIFSLNGNNSFGFDKQGTKSWLSGLCIAWQRSFGHNVHSYRNCRLQPFLWSLQDLCFHAKDLESSRVRRKRRSNRSARHKPRLKECRFDWCCSGNPNQYNHLPANKNHQAITEIQFVVNLLTVSIGSRSNDSSVVPWYSSDFVVRSFFSVDVCASLRIESHDSSSEPSAQSFSPSHIQCGGTHTLLLLHRKSNSEGQRKFSWILHEIIIRN